MTTTTQQPIQRETDSKVSNEPDFGNGKYSPKMQKVYDKLVSLFNIDEVKAEKIAKQFAIDFGAAMKNIPVETKLGKANSDNKGTLSEVSKVKGITYTNALNIVRATEWCDDAGKNGVSYGHTKWMLTPELLKYVESL